MKKLVIFLGLFFMCFILIQSSSATVRDNTIPIGKSFTHGDLFHHHTTHSYTPEGVKLPDYGYSSLKLRWKGVIQNNGARLIYKDYERMLLFTHDYNIGFDTLSYKPVTYSDGHGTVTVWEPVTKAYDMTYDWKITETFYSQFTITLFKSKKTIIKTRIPGTTHYQNDIKYTRTFKYVIERVRDGTSYTHETSTSKLKPLDKERNYYSPGKIKVKTGTVTIVSINKKLEWDIINAFHKLDPKNEHPNLTWYRKFVKNNS